jgi:hypothetical protein
MIIASAVAFPTQLAAGTVRQHHQNTEMLNVTHQLRYIPQSSETDSGSHTVVFSVYMEYFLS